MPKIKGTKFVNAYTINSMYANGKIELLDKENIRYRIDVLELLKLIQMHDWTPTMKTKYQHLTLAS